MRSDHADASPSPMKDMFQLRSQRARPGRRLGAARAGAALLAFAVLSGPIPALALQGGEDVGTLPVLVDQRYAQSSQLQLYANFSFPLVSKFVESYGVVGGATYNIRRWIGVGVVGGGFGGGEVDVISDVRLQTANELDLTDLHRMVWFAGAEATFTPIYGRISFAGEYNPAFDVFAVVGGGVVGTERDLSTGSTADGVVISSSQTTAYGNAGFGFRFHILDPLALRVSYRLFLYPEGSESQSGLTAAQQLQVGLQTNFGL